MEEYGTIRIKLEELTQKAGISKNKLRHREEMQNSQIRDLLEFVPPDMEK